MACADPDADLPGLRFETEHFRYYAADDVWICPQLGTWLEHHYASLGAYLGAALPPEGKIDYYRLDRGAAASRCGRGDASASACFDSEKIAVYSAEIAHAHELVHAYAMWLGDPPNLFQEGLAVMLGEDGTGAIDPAAPIESALTNEAFEAYPGGSGAMYLPAAGFVRFLVDRHGREALLVFYAQTPHLAGEVQIRASFMNAFGEDLDTALAAWRAAPSQTRERLSLHVAECASPEMKKGEGSLETLMCIGLYDEGPYPLSFLRRVTLDATSGVALRIQSDRISGAQLFACEHGLTPARGLLTFTPGDIGRPHELWTDLPPDDYALHVFAEGDAADTTTATVSLEVGTPRMTDHCGDAPEWSVAPDTAEVVLVGSFEGTTDDAPVDGRLDVATRFAVATAARLKPTHYESDVERTTLCSNSCPADAGASCTEDLGGAEVQPGSSYAVILGGSETPATYEFGLQFEPIP
jgi:hypothetical protein